MAIMGTVYLSAPAGRRPGYAYGPFAFLIFSFIFAAGGGGLAAAQQSAVKFDTSDGCRIEAFYSAPAKGAYTFINVHGLGSDKNEWAAFQAALKNKGYGWLSLDLRGHGGSLACGGKKADYRAFTRADWANASRDIEAGAAWLKKKKAGKLIFCGASVGANLALKAASESAARPAAVILLSPGLEYAGIRAEDYLPKAPRRLLLAAAEDDGYAWQSAAALSLAAGRKGLSAAAIDGGRGHGADMLKVPATVAKILDWVSRLP